MTPSQIADAQKLAKEWMEEHGEDENFKILQPESVMDGGARE